MTQETGVTIQQTTEMFGRSFATISDFVKVEWGMSLTDNVMDLPSVKIMMEAGTASANSTNDRTTFGGGSKSPIRQHEWTLTALVFVKTRSTLGEDVFAVEAVADKVLEMLDQQNKKPYFGLDGLKAFRHDWSIQSFPSNQNGVQYIGIEWTFYLSIY